MFLCAAPPDCLRILWVVRLESVIESWATRARAVRRDLRALYLARRDPRIPWHARVFAAIILAYALSPIDLIPDFIPVLGYLDDLVIVPLGLIALVKMLPPDLLQEYRIRADSEVELPKSRSAAIAIIVLWLSGIAVTLWLLRRHFAR